MKVPRENSKQGFTLMELIVAMALGLLVMGAMTSLFKTGLDSTRLIMQRTETQQNMRAAIDLMVKDISMAGAGLPSGGLQLPTGAGAAASNFGCDQSGTCHVPAFNYPNSNYMYGIIPGFRNGVENDAVVPSAPSPAINDSITVIYADYNFPLSEYDVTFVPGNGTGMAISPDAAFNPPPPSILSPGGIQVGDLILLQNTCGSAVGEVTDRSATEIGFADLDALRMNQNGAASNNIKAITGANCGTTSANRLFAVTYYLTVPANGQRPRLMRQVNGLSPVPVADDIINLQFAYDVYNSNNAALDANQANPVGAGDSLNLIQKINVVVMGQSITNFGNKSQNMYLATSVSARNMAFRNRYQ